MLEWVHPSFPTVFKLLLNHLSTQTQLQHKASHSRSGRLDRWIRVSLGCLGLVLHMSAHTQSGPEISAEQLRRAQERESQLRQQHEVTTDVHLPTAPGTATALLPTDETPCFPITALQLSTPKGFTSEWLLDYADGHAHLDRPDPVQGRCLGTQGIRILSDRLQNALTARGYVTSRVLVEPQNLKSGVLMLTVLPGLIGEIG